MTKVREQERIRRMFVSLKDLALPKSVANVKTPSLRSILISLMSNGRVIPSINKKCSTVIKPSSVPSIFPTRYHMENQVQVKAITKILINEMSLNLRPFGRNGIT